MAYRIRQIIVPLGSAASYGEFSNNAYSRVPCFFGHRSPLSQILLPAGARHRLWSPRSTSTQDCTSRKLLPQPQRATYGRQVAAAAAQTRNAPAQTPLQAGRPRAKMCYRLMTRIQASLQSYFGLVHRRPQAV